MYNVSSEIEKYLVGECYPVIKIPKYIKAIISDRIIFPLPKIPDAPEKPTLVLPPPPQPPEQSKISKFFGLTNSHKYRIAEYQLELYKYQNSYQKEKKEYSRLLDIYKKNLLIYEKEEIPRYQRNCNLNKQLESFLPINKNDAASRKKMIEIYLNTVPRPGSCRGYKHLIERKGIVEDFFKEHLIKKYGKQYISEVSGITTNDYVIYDGYLCLTDFVLEIPNTDIVIAIEIDEPYTSDSFEPLHYTEKNEQDDLYSWPVYTEDDRDDNINDCGWIVVRFTERQIIQSTVDCINLIETLSSWILRKTSDIDLINCINNIGIDLKWNKGDSYRMIFGEYRQSYLPDVFKTELINRNYKYNINNNRNDELPF